MADWINPLISGASGVLGALVGGGATLLASRWALRDAARREHRAALVGYYAAVMRFGHTYSVYSEALPSTASRIQRLRNRIAISSHGELLVAHILSVVNGFWEADGRMRAVATADELDALATIESVIAEWQIGAPPPAEWPDALRRLRAIVEATRDP